MVVVKERGELMVVVELMVLSLNEAYKLNNANTFE